MDYEKISLIRNYFIQIKQFRKLDKFKNMSNENFSSEMKIIFPKFFKEDKIIFEIIMTGKDLHFLDLMFKKVDEINKEFNNRKSEIDKIRNTVEDIRSLVTLNKEMDKNKIKSHIDRIHSVFAKEYPVIITRLLDEETNQLDVEQLFLDQVKHKYEVQIGTELANTYIYPKI